MVCVTWLRLQSYRSHPGATIPDWQCGGPATGCGCLGRRAHRSELIPLIEDQAGVRNARAIASASERVSALFLGSVDLSGELRSNMGWDALLKARQCVVEAGSEFGLDCIDGPWLDADDLEGLQIELGRLAAMGFTGKASYDIQQIAAIHSAFTPSMDEVGLARRIIVAVTASDTGAARVDGKSVNKANAKAARRLLALAQRRGVVESNQIAWPSGR